LTPTDIERMFEPAPAPGASDVGKRRQVPGPAPVEQPVFPRLRWHCPGEFMMPAFLARRYDEPIDAERGDDAPAAFVWRGRRHTVTAVLGHWWETGAWWRRLDEGLADDEHEMWRVEARAAGRAPVVVEVGFAWATGAWSLRAVLD
jgi:hypothetical protein